jgi:tetratricopeptide (TPR) repeat protein
VKPRDPAAPSNRSYSWLEHPLVAALLFGLVALLAWSNSFRAPFEFDDHGSILENASIRRLFPPGWLIPPATAGETVSGRPVLNFSFAVNHALNGLDVRGYHATNLLIHVLTALTLRAVLRRILPAAHGGAALAVALLWMVHPLQTAAVTYVVQRAESLSALFGLLTLLTFMRGAEGAQGTRWFTLAVACCLCGVGTKETVAVVPIIVLLYDRTFLAGSFRAAWRARGRVHAALFATWLPLALLVLANHGRGGSAGADAIGAGSYLATQCAAIIHYLRLAVWPIGQVFDYGMPLADGLGAVAGQFSVLVLLAAVTLWLCGKNRPLGFAGACFFLLLAPSSSFLPVATQTIAEHRMYLALAVPLGLGVVTVASRIKASTPGIALVVAVATALAAATFARNAVYATPLALWGDTVAKRPENPRGRYNLALALREAGRENEARAEFEQALALNPRHAFANYELGNAALAAREWSAAAVYLERAVEADPSFVAARVNLGQALAAVGRTEEAVTQYRRALADEPTAADIRVNLGALLLRQGREEEGEALLREALAMDSSLVEAHYHLGMARQRAGALGEAEAEFRAAVTMKSDFEAAGAWFALGNLLARQKRIDEAGAAFQSALARDPTHLMARASLANCQLMAGRLDEAIANYEAVLRVRPNDAAVRRNLDLAREMKRGR